MSQYEYFFVCVVLVQIWKEVSFPFTIGKFSLTIFLQAMYQKYDQKYAHDNLLLSHKKT